MPPEVPGSSVSRLNQEDDTLVTHAGLFFQNSNERRKVRTAMTVQVIHGANNGEFPLDGGTVLQVARQLKDVFNIPVDASASANGFEVDGSHIVKAGDRLEFVKEHGRKGGIQENWSESEITNLFGADAVNEMKGMGFEPAPVYAYTSDQVSSWQAKRIGKPEPSKHGLVVDPGTFSVSYLGQEPIELGNTITFRLCSRLARRPNVFVNFNALKRDVWKDEYSEDAAVGRMIGRLRAQLKDLTGISLESQKHAVRLLLN